MHFDGAIWDHFKSGSTTWTQTDTKKNKNMRTKHNGKTYVKCCSVKDILSPSFVYIRFSSGCQPLRQCVLLCYLQFFPTSSLMSWTWFGATGEILGWAASCEQFSRHCVHSKTVSSLDTPRNLTLPKNTTAVIVLC